MTYYCCCSTVHSSSLVHWLLLLLACPLFLHNFIIYVLLSTLYTVVILFSPKWPAALLLLACVTTVSLLFVVVLHWICLPSTTSILFYSAYNSLLVFSNAILHVAYNSRKTVSIACWLFFICASSSMLAVLLVHIWLLPSRTIWAALPWLTKVGNQANRLEAHLWNVV